MGAWNVGPLDNDRALDVLCNFEKVNRAGIYGMINLMLQSYFEEDVVLACALTDAIVNGFDETIFKGYEDEEILSYIIETAKDRGENKHLLAEARNRIDYIIGIGNDRCWIQWDKRLAMLTNLKERLQYERY